MIRYFNIFLVREQLIMNHYTADTVAYQPVPCAAHAVSENCTFCLFSENQRTIMFYWMASSQQRNATREAFQLMAISLDAYDSSTSRYDSSG